MPETTPIYSFPYPCEGEDITVAAFANLANAIDTQLLAVQNDEFEALNRYNTTGFSAAQVIAAGVDTVIVSADSSYTIPAAGVWIITASAGGSQPATHGSMRIRVRNNGVVQFGTRQNPETSFFTVITTGPVIAAAGDVITFQYLFSGTGSSTVQVQWSAKMIVRIA